MIALMTLAVPSGLSAIPLSFLSLKEYISLLTISYAPPTDLINKLVSSNIGVLISLSL